MDSQRLKEASVAAQCVAAKHPDMVRIVGPSEEVIHDLTTHVWSKLPRYDETLSKFCTWATRVARNRLFNMVKRESRRRHAPVADMPVQEVEQPDIVIRAAGSLYHMATILYGKQHATVNAIATLKRLMNITTRDMTLRLERSQALRDALHLASPPTEDELRAFTKDVLPEVSGRIIAASREHYRS